MSFWPKKQGDRPDRIRYAEDKFHTVYEDYEYLCLRVFFPETENNNLHHIIESDQTLCDMLWGQVMLINYEQGIICFDSADGFVNAWRIMMGHKKCQSM